MEIDEDLYKKKKEILNYFRTKANIPLKNILKEKKRETKSKLMNNEVKTIAEALISKLLFLAKSEKWDNSLFLNNILIVYYCSYVVMIEYRNKVWSYEYMAFSRRIGELWELFCELLWKYNINEDIKLFYPPMFKDIKKKLEEGINEFIDKLKITSEGKGELLGYYGEMWKLVTSGEINMKLDVHFEYKNKKYVTDLKSGFSSNEKGNTNRLLLVASIYKLLKDDYECLIFVRSSEDETNHYLQTLKNSGNWQVYCGDHAYVKMKEFTGFDIKDWINKNVDWKNDFDKETIEFFEKNKLDIYLKW